MSTRLSSFSCAAVAAPAQAQVATPETICDMLLACNYRGISKSVSEVGE
ncbi:hypothetical protein [Methanosarcina vacuolata]|nr:hypothetical protein [Methanosarcina vacuolata]